MPQAPWSGPHALVNSSLEHLHSSLAALQWLLVAHFGLSPSIFFLATPLARSVGPTSTGWLSITSWILDSIFISLFFPSCMRRPFWSRWK
ncbi:hypothetical protein QBC42DRAFT_87540 [Cladorrhinum samala]|uniref:Uncharacterized protein n=1 Tax=Cladorrhinum samala TaxID=585594 RepID=A0AAV9HMC5_9PEZI|nr:hypothetical protein QBC42DRAFT_87540 [Cladorrhinum samala]